MKFNLAVFLGAFSLYACAPEPALDLGYGPEPTTSRYTDPSESGLVAVRPFPGPDDVCVVVGENDLTREFLDDSATLIGCPKHETGAIADRAAQGARVVAHARHWTLLSVPMR
ncbi:hypothetical protein ACERZ8_07490 [Tateyamaria armeniaca]|uniref:Uncharacterized protein n=1 Tax=Tateyamaria armeniaca TaxID=2518930 RepID=A0ABW8URH3_9RHOB